MAKAELTEDYLVEQSAIGWLKNLNYSYIHGAELSPEKEERESYRNVILKKRFIDAVKRLNPWLSENLAEKVYKKVADIDHPDFVMKSKIFYEMLTKGVKIKIRERGRDKTKIVKLIDFETPENNEFLAANQFSVEYQYQNDVYRRPDLVVFVNGLPIAVFEFKNFNANETAKDAYYDHKNKMEDIPQLYVYAQILGASDGLETKYGSVTSDWDRFFVWEGIFDDNDLEAKEIEENRYYYIFKPKNQEMTSLEVLLNGLFRKEHLTEYLEDFVFFEKSGEKYEKKIAMFHQFYVVRKAIERTRESVLKGKTPDERRIGIVWHTQGTGKSLTMLFYARKALKLKELENPLLVFITDRNNLDEQLYGVFSELPIAKQAKSIKDLQGLITPKAGGIIFTTIQKFGRKKAEEYPLLTQRKNIVVIADEAHRSQYRELAMNLRRAIPNASFMGFTATPIELQDRSTSLVFGEHISVYSMDKAKRHKVVVPIYYEARLSKLHLTNEFIDEEFEKISEEVAKDPQTKQSLKKRFARLEKLMLAEDRMDEIAKDIEDIVTHFNKRVQEFEGKAIVVTISRKIAVKLYEKIMSQPKAPSTVVVISGNKQRDPKEYWPHLRNKHETEELANNFKNPETDPKLAIVVDMWLTGFDVPCLHTMYFDKPMKDHSLVQAIARVNRVFRDKPGGLIVDYIGIVDNIRKSLSVYTIDTIKEIFININEVISLLKEKYDIVSSLFHGIDYKGWTKLKPTALSKLTTLAYDRISKEEDTKKRFIRNFVALKKLYALASPHHEAYTIKDDIRFFEMIKKMIVKYSMARVKDIHRDLEYEISHLISKSITAEEPIDVFSLMGKGRPEISIFDEKFLARFKDMEYKNYAAELLAKIIRDELIVRTKTNPFRYRSLYDMMNKIIEKYNVKLIDTAEVIEELINIANEIKKAVYEGKKLNLSDEELAFYDLLASEKNCFENYKEVEEVVKEIVKEMGYYIKVADWNRKEYIKAKIKAAVKNVLIKVIDGRVSYKEIERLSTEVISHAMMIYATA
ncbi:MAG: type I restriction endonuclease subunit R [Deltaproteobacteria bacterium]|nr:type I restriction endonuclease subunit R [Deltaproteobacteria bacterium]